MKNKTKEYRDTKNYLHNELKITKKYVNSLLQDFVEKQATEIIENKIDKIVDSQWVGRIIINELGKILEKGVKSEADWAFHFDTNKGVKYLDSVIKNVIVDEVTKRITFKEIKVE